MKKFTFLSFFLFLIYIIPVQGQGNFWQSFGGPYGGTINKLAVNSQDELYGGSFAGLFRSVDNGSTWQSVSPEVFNSHYVTSIAFNSMGDIFVGTTQSGIYRSTDGGANWDQKNNGLTNTDVYSLAIGPNQDIFVGTTTGVFKSANNGEGWSYSGLSNSFVQSIVIDNNNEIFVTDFSGVSQSTDGGGTWNAINNGLTSLPKTLALSPAASARGQQELYAGSTGGGVFKFDRLTQLWTAIAAGLTTTYVVSLVVNYAGDVFAGTDLGIFRLLAGSATWTQLAVQGLFYYYIASLAVNSLGHIFACEDWGGIFRSLDNGNIWVRFVVGLTAYTINTMFFSQALAALFIGTDMGLWRRNAGSNLWSLVETPYAFFWVTAIAATTSYIFAGSFYDGMWRLSTSTNQWTQINIGLTNLFVTALAINALGHIFVGTSGGGVFRSIDNGDTWTQVISGLAGLYISSLVFGPLGYLYAATSVGVFKMDPATFVWTAINAGLTTLYVTALAFSATGVLYASTSGGGIFKSVNFGLAWTAIITGLTYLYIDQILSRHNSRGISDELFASSYGGVFHSDDGGASWNPLNSGLNASIPLELAADSSGGVFVGSTGGGVFQNGVATSVKQIGTDIPSRYELKQNFPNPFNPSTTIRFSLPEAGFITLKIFNSVGEEIALLVNDEKQAGAYQVTWNAEGLASGVYFYSLITGKGIISRRMLLLK